MSKIHKNNKHHVHNLSDCEDLVRQQGHEIGKSFEDFGECYAESSERAAGMKHTPAFFVRLYKRAGNLEVHRV